MTKQQKNRIIEKINFQCLPHPPKTPTHTYPSQFNNSVHLSRAWLIGSYGDHGNINNEISTNWHCHKFLYNGRDKKNSGKPEILEITGKKRNRRRKEIDMRKRKGLLVVQHWVGRPISLCIYTQKIIFPVFEKPIISFIYRQVAKILKILHKNPESYV